MLPSFLYVLLPSESEKLGSLIFLKIFPMEIGNQLFILSTIPLILSRARVNGPVIFSLMEFHAVAVLLFTLFHALIILDLIAFKIETTSDRINFSGAEMAAFMPDHAPFVIRLIPLHTVLQSPRISPENTLMIPRMIFNADFTAVFTIPKAVINTGAKIPATARHTVLIVLQTALNSPSNGASYAFTALTNCCTDSFIWLQI